jgi:hypothetical protein
MENRTVRMRNLEICHTRRSLWLFPLPGSPFSPSTRSLLASVLLVFPGSPPTAFMASSAISPSAHLTRNTLHGRRTRGSPHGHQLLLPLEAQKRVGLWSSTIGDHRHACYLRQTATPHARRRAAAVLLSSCRSCTRACAAAPIRPLPHARARSPPPLAHPPAGRCPGRVVAGGDIAQTRVRAYHCMIASAATIPETRHDLDLQATFYLAQVSHHGPT